MLICYQSYGQKPRARDLGVPFNGITGINNAITDVKGVEVGYSTIIVIVATDAPFLPHQLKRIAQRVPLGIGIVGGRGSNGSGDIFLAFSTANENAFSRDETTVVETYSNDLITPFFDATVQAVEEAIINAMIAAETMEGINGNKAYALPHDLLIETLKKYNRIKE